MLLLDPSRAMTIVPRKFVDFGNLASRVEEKSKYRCISVPLSEWPLFVVSCPVGPTVDGVQISTRMLSIFTNL